MRSVDREPLRQNREFFVGQYRTDKVALGVEHEKYTNAGIRTRSKARIANFFDDPHGWAEALTDPKNKVIILPGTASLDVTQESEELKLFNKIGMPAVRRVMEQRDKYVLGVCFGGQLEALAIDGDVVRDPNRWEGGTADLTPYPAGEDFVLFKGYQEKIGSRIMPVLTGHKDSMVLPVEESIIVPDLDEVVRLGYTQRDENSAWIFGDRKVAVQFHPESPSKEGFLRVLELSKNSPLGPYPATYDFKDTPDSPLMIDAFITAALKGEPLYIPPAVIPIDIYSASQNNLLLKTG